ncbi:MAG: hypothetical protein FWG31_06580 [Oscillospiraceae bacterium]|nr:hypothetical protein [Oscillospiraceae bacterium]
MFIYLNTQFTDEENKVIHNYCNSFNTELSVLYGVNKDLFGDEGIDPLRIIITGGYYLLEEKGEEGEWHIGQHQDDKYVFWSKYKSLEKALTSL